MANSRNLKFALMRLVSWFRSLSHRDRVALTVLVTALLVFGSYMIVDETRTFLQNKQQLVETRVKNLEQLSKIIARYSTLNGRLKIAEETFAKSQLTFEEAFSELDKIIKTNISSSDFDPRKGQVSPVGLEYEKQEFNVQLKGISLDQLVHLLFELEQGQRPLFLGKVDIARSPVEGQFNATLEVFSIRKRA